jgi:DNA-directed RNA polymerase subunit H (RpoH/RPB5)
LKEVDISKHKIVPQHVILNEKEKKELLEKYNITLNQLPRILTSDPMVQKLDAQIGDVIKITRISQTAGNIQYYRVVVKGAFK